MDIRRSPANFKLNTIWQFYEGGEADGWSEPIFSTCSWQDTPSEKSCRTSLSEASMHFLRCVLRLIPRCQVDHSVTEMMACWRIASFQKEIVHGILKRLPFQWAGHYKVYPIPSRLKWLPTAGLYQVPTVLQLMADPSGCDVDVWTKNVEKKRWPIYDYDQIRNIGEQNDLAKNICDPMRLKQRREAMHSEEIQM